MLPGEKRTSFAAGRVRSVATQTRIYASLVAFALCLLFTFIAIFTPLIVLRNEDSAYVDDMARLERQLANEAVIPFRQAIANASTLSKAMQGYIISRMTRLPDLNSSAAARMASQDRDFDDFHYMVPTIAKGVEFIAMVALQPGGVYWKMYPNEPTMVGRDVLQPSDYAHNYVPTPLDSFRTGEVAYIGPAKSSIKFMHNMWTVTVRRPIYNRSTALGSVVPELFWGFSISTVNISGVLASRPFDSDYVARNKRAKVDYLLTTRASNASQRVLVATSLGPINQEGMEAFISQGTSVVVTPNHDFMVTVRGRDYGSRLSADNVTIVVSTVLAGMFLLFAAFAALTLFRCPAYDASTHAPKMAPFAMLTVGPCRGEELWELAPDEMVGVTDRLGRVLAKQMVRHHAYQIQQVHPLTTSYVTRSVAAAVQMAFDAIEELQSAPIDEPLRHLLGDDGVLLLSYAVHWCNDAVVRLDPMEGGYRYEGPDVVYGGRMWAFAAPSVVTASEAVAQALPRFGLRCVTAAPLRRVNVVRSRSVCGATGDGAMMNGCGNSSTTSSGGGAGAGAGAAAAAAAAAATIYVPFPAPTTVEATAGMGMYSGGGAAPAVGAHHTRKDVVLPPQTLLTLVDTRRPLLLAARAAAPTPRQAHDWPPPLPPDTAAVPPVERVTVQHVNVQSQLIVAHSNASFPSSAEESPSAALPAPRPVVTGIDTSPSHRTSADIVRSSMMIQGDGVTRALLRPVIPHALDVALHAAFDYQAITLGMAYEAARVPVYYFYSSYKILFRPLAAPERHNIYRRLVTAFGVPPQGILEHLAARCAIRCLQQSAKLRMLATQRRRPSAGEAPLPIAMEKERGPST